MNIHELPQLKAGTSWFLSILVAMPPFIAIGIRLQEVLMGEEPEPWQRGASFEFVAVLSPQHNSSAAYQSWSSSSSFSPPPPPPPPSASSSSSCLQIGRDRRLFPKDPSEDVQWRQSKVKGLLHAAADADSDPGLVSVRNLSAWAAMPSPQVMSSRDFQLDRIMLIIQQTTIIFLIR